MSEAVRSMFAGISKRYDLMNTVITLGMHHAWRRRAVGLSSVRAGDRVLDVASGTGDFALEFAEKVGKGGHVTATDFCKEMLDYLPPKINTARHAISIEIADAMHLPYPSASFDVVSIAYGIRNVDDPNIALSEMVRVLKVLYEMFRRIIPIAGKLIAGNSDAYSYLPRTASQFPYGSEFVRMMRNQPAVREAVAYPLFFGVSYIYVATVKG